MTCHLCGAAPEDEQSCTPDTSPVPSPHPACCCCVCWAPPVPDPGPSKHGLRVPVKQRHWGFQTLIVNIYKKYQSDKYGAFNLFITVQKQMLNLNLKSLSLAWIQNPSCRLKQKSSDHLPINWLWNTLSQSKISGLWVTGILYDCKELENNGLS